jgi:predicted nuclease of predicted toxin-antitoxin system
VKILVDMNLSPEWLEVLKTAGFEALHWKEVGSPTAADEEIFKWARENKRVVMTQDLDFSQLLFRAGADGPSVILLRIQNELDKDQQARVCAALRPVEEALEAGAMVVIDDTHVRVRRIPI